MKNILLALFLLIFSIQCVQKKEKPSSLDAVVKGEHRSSENRQRDTYRHPIETLEFFEVEPEMTVVEVSPGKGWYTEILAPYLQGKLYLAGFDDNSEREYFRNANRVLKENVKKNQKLYGDVEFRVFEMPAKIGPIAPANSVDRVLTFRNVHNWMKSGKAEEAFKEFYRVLKKGGMLGVVEHRANAQSKKDPKAESGYVHVDQVKKLAKQAGFKFVASSEINANPKDSAKHPKGVWTLPPVLRLGDKNKEKYTEIGESDRMTLKFIK